MSEPFRVLFTGPPGPAGLLSGSVTATGGVTARTLPERFGRTLSFLDFGAVGGGVTDDSVAVAAAFASGAKLTGNGLIYAVTGNFTLSDNFDIQDFEFKQLSPNLSARRTITKTSGSGSGVMRRVKVNRNGATTDGVINDAGGIWLANIDDLVLEDVEVYGNGPGTGIYFQSCDRLKLTRCWVRDITWTAPGADPTLDPGSEQVQGVRFQTCTDIEVDDLRIDRLRWSNGNRAYQSDGLVFAACTNGTVRGGRISFCGEGVDISGSGQNTNIWFYGTDFYDCGAHSLKWVHEYIDCGAVGCRSFRAGYVGFIAAGGSGSHTTGGRGLRVIGCVSRDTGENGNWVASIVAGFACHEGTYPPRDVVFSDCSALDKQRATCTITIASPGVVTKAAHGFTANDPCEFYTTGALPTGLTADTVYYVKTVLSVDTFTVSATAGGTVINTSGSQSGTQQVSQWTMKYGFRNEPGTTAACRLINPEVHGATIADYLSFTAGIERISVSTPSEGRFRLAGASVGDPDTYSSNVSVKGLFAKQRYTLTLAVTAGANHNVPAPAKGRAIIGGDTGAFLFSGFIPTLTDGEEFTAHYSGVNTCTLLNNSAGSSVGNRIWTMNGDDVKLTGPFVFKLSYNGATTRWELEYFQDAVSSNTNVNVKNLFAKQRYVLTLAVGGGANHDIPAPAKGRAIIGGDTGAFSLGGFVPTLTDGEELTVHYDGGNVCTLLNNSAGSTVGNRIRTMTVLDVALTGPFVFKLSYNGAASVWDLEYFRHAGS